MAIDSISSIQPGGPQTLGTLNQTTQTQRNNRPAPPQEAVQKPPAAEENRLIAGSAIGSRINTTA